MVKPPAVIVVGAGVAGLACALTLHKAGRNVLVLEAAEAVGGRVRSHKAGDFVLDRGFQVLLTAYPTCRVLLDFEALRLGTFQSGALVQLPQGEFTVSDPFRRWADLHATLRAPVGSLRDKLLIGKLRMQARWGGPEQVGKTPNMATAEWLRLYGFSAQVIEQFFRPFFSGIFLEKDLATSAQMFRMVYRYFTLGNAALPACGMEAIPRQMAAKLGAAQIMLNTRVEYVRPGSVRLADGRELEAPRMVIATDAVHARRWVPGLPVRGWHGGVTYYFDAPRSPFLGRRRKLWLNATGSGCVNHIAVSSDVAAGYAPLGRALVSVNTVGDADTPASDDAIKSELMAWLGDDVLHWKFLRKYAIARALPVYDPDAVTALVTKPQVAPGLFLCGDALGAGSLETAMASGVEAAKACLVS